MASVSEGQVLWEPRPERIAASRMQRFVDRLRGEGRVDAPDYESLWHWSVTDLPDLWSAVADHFEVEFRDGYDVVLGDRSMPGATWFPGAELNYAREALRIRGDAARIVHRSEGDATTMLTADELRSQVAAVASGLRRLGVGTGDRVGAYLPNVPEAVVAFLATASLGAVWSSCPPEFGPRSVVDRFGQIGPTVLFATDRYRYRGRIHDRRDVVEALRTELPTLEHVIRVPYEGASPAPHRQGEAGSPGWGELVADPAPLDPTWVPFEHPLWIVYSSGTTGPPKPIVHSHGGVVLEHLKWLGLHTDLGVEDRFFWFTTTGWIMWNVVVGSLLTGAAAVLYDGDPAYPAVGRLWDVAEQTGVTCFGGSPPYFDACRKERLVPRERYDLSRLRSVGSTGAPLTPDGFAWLYQAVGSDVHVGSASGGTDVASAFVGPCPLLPVRAGEIQCRLLGAAVEAYDPNGKPVVDQVGELVVTEPLPSMPIRFWNDPDGQRYRESYFDTYPGVWRHGDWIRITERGSCVITGRSDATLKRSGVRMGTSEFYTVIEALPEIADSLVVDVPLDDGHSELLLLVAVEGDERLTENLRGRIEECLRRELSPRHVPDAILQVTEVPRTLNGKKLEVPVKRLFSGTPVDEAVSLGSVANPGAIRELAGLAAGHRERGITRGTGSV